MKIGVILPLATDPVTGRGPSYQDIRRWALAAEQLGFDSVWIYDHLLVRRPDQRQLGVWEGWTVMTAVAEATERVTLGSWVTCVGFRSPALLAKMAATLDEVSGGRLILGLGAGNQRPEFDAFGFDYDRRVARFEEAIQIVAPLLRDGRVDFEGTYYSARDCEIEPRGPRPKGPPILMGADGPRMMRLAARHADLWTCTYLGDPQKVVEPRDRLAAACLAEGRDPAGIEVAVGEWIVYPDGSAAPAGIQAHTLGSPETVAELLDGYDRVGVHHVLLQSGTENYDTVLQRFGEAADAYRRAATPA